MSLDRRGATINATDPAVQSDPNPGIAIKAPCLVATTANITLSGLQTIDGVVLVANNRVLVKNQTTASLNGIYTASTGTWQRASDLRDNSQIAAGCHVYITAGTTQNNTEWVVTTADPITVGTTSMTWAQQQLSITAFNTLLSSVASNNAATHITVTAQSSVLPNSRMLSSTAPITLTDSGAGAAILVGLTTPLAALYGGTGLTSFTTLNNQRQAVSSSTSVLNGWKGKTIALSGNSSGAVKTLTVPSPASLDSDFWTVVLNEDSREWTISPSGGTAFFLWPKQSKVVLNQNNVWYQHPQFERYAPTSLTLFVDSVNGSDSNGGLVANTGAVLTISKALDILDRWIDVGNASPNLQLADATYNVGSGININYLNSARNILINGNLTTPANVIISCDAGGNCFNIRDGASTVTLGGMTLHTTGNGSTLLSVSQNAVGDICNSGRVNFDNTPLGVHMDATTWSSINVGGPYTVNGGAAIHLRSRNGAYINYGSFVVTGASGLTVTTFAVATDCGVINAGGSPMTFSGFGSITGAKYAVTNNGVIDSSTTTYPGTGTTSATGGQYS